MNRWQQRLAELHGDTGEPPSAPSPAVQNVQNVQNPAPAPPFEHFEQIEQSAKAPGEPSTATDRALATWGEAEEERAAIVERPPVFLTDGRLLHRFHADTIPSRVTGNAAALLNQARWHGAVLVADGHELIIVERWQSTLPPETLRGLKEYAGPIIAMLRGESRSRSSGRAFGAD